MYFLWYSHSNAYHILIVNYVGIHTKMLHFNRKNSISKPSWIFETYKAVYLLVWSLSIKNITYIFKIRKESDTLELYKKSEQEIFNRYSITIYIDLIVQSCFASIKYIYDLDYYYSF